MRLRVLAAAIGGVAIGVAAVAAQDALTALGLRPDQAKADLFQVLREGRVYGTPGYAAFKAATADVRVALVNGALGWAKEYTQSAEFAKRYATTRSQAEPRLSMGRKWSAEEEVTKRQALLDRRIEMEKKRLEDPPSPRQTPEQQQAQRKSNEDRIKGMEAERARYDNPTERAALRKPFEVEDQRYAEDRVKWQEQYPPDYQAAIAKRLRQFLDASAGIDFSAKLVPCRDSWQHHVCFADPNYEKKPAEWKLYYRAGRQPVEAARAFVATWLAEIEKK